MWCKTPANTELTQFCQAFLKLNILFISDVIKDLLLNTQKKWTGKQQLDLGNFMDILCWLAYFMLTGSTIWIKVQRYLDLSSIINKIANGMLYSSNWVYIIVSLFHPNGHI